MQLEGFCRENVNDENAIYFYCTHRGKIFISDPPRMHKWKDISTQLFADIIEQDGKTYVSYYTSFSDYTNAISIILLIIMLISVIFSIISEHKTLSLITLFICLVAAVCEIYSSAKEKSNSPTDSEILVKELEKRVNAVNLWDK